MGVPIWEIEHFKENDRIMLDQLVERSKKKKHAEVLHQGILTMFIIISIAFIAWLFLLNSQTSYSGDVFTILFYFFTNEINVIGYVLLACLFTFWRYKHTTYKKEKDKYDDLRSEVIEKKDKYWPDHYEDELLDKLVSELEGDYDINVSYKS